MFCCGICQCLCSEKTWHTQACEPDTVHLGAELITGTAAVFVSGTDFKVAGLFLHWNSGTEIDIDLQLNSVNCIQTLQNFITATLILKQICVVKPHLIIILKLRQSHYKTTFS